MPEYIAEIKGTASEYSFGGNRPYDVREERIFFADDDNDAYKVAKDSVAKLRRELILASLTLDSLDEVRHVDLSAHG